MVVFLTVLTIVAVSRFAYKKYKKRQRHLDHGLVLLNRLKPFLIKLISERTNLDAVLSDIRFTSGNLRYRGQTW